jgi:hypothetical protein
MRCPRVAAKATEAAAPEAAEASTTSARRIADSTHAYEASARPLAWLAQDEESCGSGGEAGGEKDWGKGVTEFEPKHLVETDRHIAECEAYIAKQRDLLGS